MSDPTKIGIISYLDERISKLETRIRGKRAQSTTLRDWKVEKRTLESVKRWIEL